MTIKQAICVCVALSPLASCGGNGAGSRDANDAEPPESAPKVDGDKTGDVAQGDAAGKQNEAPTLRRTHYEIEYPSSWSLNENPPEGVDSLANAPTEVAGAFQESLNVVIEKLPQPMTTPEFALAVTSGMQQMVKGFSLLSTDEIRLNDGTQAVETVYKSNFQQELHHIAVMLADKAERGYVVTGTATPDTFREFAPVFRKSIKTFKVRK